MAAGLTPLKPKSPMTVCGAKNRQGLPCKQAQGWGTDHPGFGNCKLHGGGSPSGVKHAAKERALWQQTLADEIDPSLRVVRQIRDGDDVAPRDRLRAAQDLLDRAGVTLEERDGQVNIVIPVIRWPGSS